ncbi:hypothetical protein FCV25MIE_08375 [Fagus crenata]
MDSIFPVTFNNPDPPTFAPEGINPNPMTFSGNDSLLGNIDSPPGDLPWSNSDDLELDNNLIANWLASELDNPPIEDMENPQTGANDRCRFHGYWCGVARGIVLVKTTQVCRHYRPGPSSAGPCF